MNPSGLLAAGSDTLATMKLFVVVNRAIARVLVALMVWIPLVALVSLPVQAQVATVTIGTSLDPASLTVVPGTTVTWDNIDSERHRVQSTSGPDEFDSGNMEPGESFAFTFTVEGTYQYEDARNPDLSNYWGTIVVAADGTAPPPPPGGSADFTMAGKVFRPTSITVDPGTTVTFLNDDDRDHTVTATDLSYDSGIMNPGDSYQRVYSTPGTFQFFCAIHPDMVATVVVNGADGEPPPPPPPPDPPPPPPPGDVEIIDFAFNPDVITVPVGATLTFVNAGAALHTVTAIDGTFDSGLMPSGQTFARSFDTAGTFNIFCTLHPSMTATVLVSDGGEPPPPAPPPPEPPPSPPVDGDMVMVDFAYQPTSLTVDVGSTVTFVNAGVAPHTVTSRSGRFDSGFIASGDTYSRTFDVPGTYQIFCTIHPEMSAAVIVPGAGGAVPPPAPPPPPPPVTVGGDIQVFDFGYSPASITLPVGTTLSWVNTGVALHTVTDKAGSFDSGFLNTGDTYSRTFGNAGTFAIFCTLHPNMQSLVIVTGADGTAPPPEDPLPAATPVALRSGDIEMGDFFYSPASVTITEGGTIRWVNTGAALHTVTAADGSFDSGFKATGESYTRTFARAGTFNIFCIIHPQMVGTVTVVDASGNAPPPSEPVAGPELDRPGGAPVAEGGGGGVFVRVIDFGYQPATVTAALGDEITFFNAGAAPHTVTDTEGTFDSGIFQSGESYRLVPDEVGVFSIFCTLHPQMVATLVVTEAPADEAAGSGAAVVVSGLVGDLSDAVAGDPDWHQVPSSSPGIMFGLLAFLLAMPAAVWRSWRRASREIR